MTQWDVEMHVRIAGAIKAARGKRSAQWLADRTADLGYPISRAQIANYESGRKKNLDIAELLVIAAALDTSPVNLVFPGPYDAQVEFLPGRHESELDAAEWFSGIEAPDSLVGPILDGEQRLPFHGDWNQWESNTAFLQLNRTLGELQQMRNDFLSDHDRNNLNEVAARQLKSVEDQIRLLKKQISDRYRDA